MKSIPALILLVTVVFNRTSAATLTAIQDGNWTSASTWNLNRAPQNTDVVVVPPGRTVFFQNAPYSKADVPSRPALDIRIYGSLDFSNAGNDKLYLDIGSTIQIFSGGVIETESPGNEIIAIFNGLLDNTVWTGLPISLAGPRSATGYTLGFTNAVLPLTLISFEAKSTGTATALLTWQTAEEIGTSHFDVQQYSRQEADWKTIGRVNAAGYSSGNKSYTFNVNAASGTQQYRLKMVDIDGKYSLSPVRQITGEGSGVSITYLSHQKKLVVTQAIASGQTLLVIYDMNGNQVLHQTFSGRYEANIPSNLRGMYIAQVNSYSGNRLTKKIIF